MDKACEACKRGSAKHHASHEVLRLPVVLAIHLKRFSFADLGGGRYR